MTEQKGQVANLGGLRRAYTDLTQSSVIPIIGMQQGNLSQLERRPIERVKLATISKYVEAIGGQVELWATFTDENNQQQDVLLQINHE